MQTILRVLDLARDARNETELVQFIEAESDTGIVGGDLLGAGEWLTNRLNYPSGIEHDAITAKVLALSSSMANPRGPDSSHTKRR